MLDIRPATAEDQQFVDNLVFGTMQGYLEATWPQDLDAHRQYYEINAFDPRNTFILQQEGKDVGRLSRTIYPDHIFIYELHVLPEHHRRGIGRAALALIFKEAELKKLPIRATVLIVNQASRNLCLSLGFRVVGVRDHRLQLEYLPRSCFTGG